MLGLILALSLSTHAIAHEARSAEAHALVTAQAAERQATIMRSLVRRGDAAAVAYVVRAVGEGLPPVALVAFLEAARTHPNPAYAPVLQRLAAYRSTRIRAWALLALASIGEGEAHRAVRRAMTDADVRVRLLGLEMAQTHTTPELEEAALRLLDRDPEVAALWAGQPQ
jgi:HEAT repeat protein